MNAHLQHSLSTSTVILPPVTTKEFSSERNHSGELSLESPADVKGRELRMECLRVINTLMSFPFFFLLERLLSNFLGNYNQQIKFSSLQSLSHVQLFATLWTTAHQDSLSITNSQSPPKPMSIVSVMPSNHLILCHPLLLLPSIFPSIRVFSNVSALPIRWPNIGVSASNIIRLYTINKQFIYHMYVLGLKQDFWNHTTWEKQNIWGYSVCLFSRNVYFWFNNLNSVTVLWLT